MHDDPLLDGLLALCALHQKPASAAMLTTGLPLPAQQLTADLLARAAARAGLQGRLLQRKLDSIPPIAMPALLLLKDGRRAVLLGGQGEDEPMSEAECIRDHLVAGGIDADRILLEDRSTSTEENMRYSLPMLRSLETDVESVGIVTNDFHVFRALCLARKNGGFTFYGVPARSTVFGFIHYAMREFFTLSVSLVRGYI